MSWPKVALGDVLVENSMAVSVDAETAYPMSGIYSYARGLFPKSTILGLETEYKRFRRVEPQQLVLSTLKGWEGAVALASDDDAGRYLPPHNILFDVRVACAEPAYLGFAVRQPALWESLKGASRGMGARRETVSPADLLDFNIPLPPLDEQRRIVARLDAAAKAVDARRSGAEAVEAEIAATLRAAFARITADAPRARMGDIAPLVRRPVPIDPDTTYPELGVRSFGKGTFHKPSLPGADVGSKKLFTIAAGDLLFNIVFAWEGAVAIAATEDAGRVGSHRFLTCVADAERASADFLRYWFLSEEGLLALNRASPGGAGRNRTLGIKALEAITVPIPSLDAQRWFDSLQAQARAARAAQAEAATHLDRLLPSLLHQEFG